MGNYVKRALEWFVVSLTCTFPPISKYFDSQGMAASRAAHLPHILRSSRQVTAAARQNAACRRVFCALHWEYSRGATVIFLGPPVTQQHLRMATFTRYAVGVHGWLRMLVKLRLQCIGNVCCVLLYSTQLCVHTKQWIQQWLHGNGATNGNAHALRSRSL